MSENSNKIDVVISWVDGNDPEWRASKAEWEKKIKGITDSGNGDLRYRDWDNLQYIFRGIETFMPWVNKVHFVTWGHLPAWLNTECEKLHIVNHKDYIPEEYLPTFNSNTIDLNFHRIPGIAEQFLYFNDDMFVIQKSEPEDFFVNGLPKDLAVVSPSPAFRDVICNIECNNLGIINDYFTPADIKKNRKKWYSSKYGKFMLRTMIFSKFSSIIGLFEPHVPFSHLRSTMTELWDKEFDALDQTCRNKFRTKEDVNEWLFRQWQIMSGKFEPRRYDFGIYTRGSEYEYVSSLFKNPGHTHLVCINDSTTVTDYEECKKQINKALDELLPDKSKFEK